MQTHPVPARPANRARDGGQPWSIPRKATYETRNEQISRGLLVGLPVVTVLAVLGVRPNLCLVEAVGDPSRAQEPQDIAVGAEHRRVLHALARLDVLLAGHTAVELFRVVLVDLYVGYIICCCLLRPIAPCIAFAWGDAYVSDGNSAVFT